MPIRMRFLTIVYSSSNMLLENSLRRSSSSFLFNVTFPDIDDDDDDNSEGVG